MDRREEAAVGARPLPSQVVTVCVGNVCRSPIAHALLAVALRERGTGVQVTSAGVRACVGLPADPLSIQLMAERGIDISGHRGRQLLPKQVDGDTLLMVMSDDQARWIRRQRGRLSSQVAALGRFTVGDIDDPVGGTRAQFERALGEIEDGIQAWLEQGWALPHPRVTRS
ncbi:MAG: low molecular weight phosphotyrosine protein phosphatase [Pseudomonadota bacterium]